jgi:formate dehydrogenase major subunit
LNPRYVPPLAAMDPVLVDGRALAPDGARTILELLNRSGIDVPQVCYHPGLGPIEACDTCIVELDGRLIRSCATPVTEGQRISVHSGRAADARHRALARLLQDHDLVCSICDKNGSCVLHTTVLKAKISAQEFRPKPYARDASNPFYVYDPSHCILCGRCVEACQDVVVNEVITIDWKLTPPRVVWDRNAPIDRSSCVSCGACVSVCPVDALMPKSILGEAGFLTGMRESTKESMTRLVRGFEPALGGFRPVLRASELEARTRPSFVRKTKTVCTFCGVGCSFDVWTKGRKILQIQPRPESPANGMATCIKGKFGWDFVNSPDRLTTPMIREGDRFRPVGWDEAIRFIAARLTAIRAAAGPDAIGVLANCTGSNEEAFLLQKLARAVIGTHNIDNCARYCQAPASTGLIRTVGIGADAGAFEDIEGSELVITVGSNTAESHPVLAGKIKRAQKLRGQKLVVLDLRKTPMAERADLFVRPRPGTDLVVLNTVARYILDQGWEARAFLDRRTTNFEAYRASLAPFSLEYGEEISGVPRDQIVRLATMIHVAKSVCILWAMGVTQHQPGTETSTAICDLLLLTGNFGRPFTGGYPLRGHCNVQGASDFGALPTFYGGYERWDDPAVVERYEKGWSVRLPTRKGLTSTEMVDATLAGSLKAMLIFGEDKVLADAHESRTVEALDRLELLVVCEVVPTATSRRAHVVLPAAATLEREGSFVNTERRIQRFHQALPPLGESRPELEIIQQLANALGAAWNYAGPADVMREASALVPRFAGVSYDRLEGYASQQWPVDADGRDSRYLYAEQFAFPDGKAHFHPPQWIPPLAADREFDLYLNNGRVLEQFHWGNLTYRDAGITAKMPAMYLEVSPELARERGLADGDRVRLRSASGAIRLKVLVTDRVQGTVMWVGIHEKGENAVNRLTSDARDPTTKTGAYKEIPVALEKLPPDDGGGGSPLATGNPRRYRGVAQLGVQVAEKWKRPDYVRLVD